MSVNKFIGIGRLARDPEMKEISSDFKVANFSIAISEKWKDKATGEQKEQTEWINCQASNKIAEFSEKYLKKGGLIFVEGKLKTRSWEKDGVKQYATYIHVDSIELLGKKESGEEKLPTYDSALQKPNLPPSEMAASGDEDSGLPF